MDYQQLFEAFGRGTNLHINRDVSKISYEYWTDLSLPTGELIVCDAFGHDDDSAFLELLPPGKYPIIASAFYGCADLVAILFKDIIPTTWKPAIRSDGNYIITSEFSHGCMLDKRFRYISALKDVDNQEWFDLYGRHWEEYCLDDDEQGCAINTVGFTGQGQDGSYILYFGYDDNEQITCLVAALCQLTSYDSNELLEKKPLLLNDHIEIVIPNDKHNELLERVLLSLTKSDKLLPAKANNQLRYQTEMVWGMPARWHPTPDLVIKFDDGYDSNSPIRRMSWKRQDTTSCNILFQPDMNAFIGTFHRAGEHLPFSYRGRLVAANKQDTEGILLYTTELYCGTRDKPDWRDSFDLRFQVEDSSSSTIE